MKAIKVRADGSIKLPQEVLRSFPVASELGVWIQGDMMVPKRLQPITLLQIAERVPEESPSLEEIAAEVHQLRFEKRQRHG
jgi:hypothetical protein